MHCHSESGYTKFAEFVRALCVRTSDWNIPQSRGRIYILLVRNNLASVEDLKMFHHLFDQFLPKNTPERKTTVKQVRDYVKSLLEAYGEEPVLPQPAQDWVPNNFSRAEPF